MSAKSEMMRFRITPEDRLLLEEAAEAAGVTSTTFMRRAVLSSVREGTLADDPESIIASLREEIAGLKLRMVKARRLLGAA